MSWHTASSFPPRLPAAPEHLESRIAPAAVFVNSRTVRYTDLDGDTVTLTSSAPIFRPDNLGSFLTFSNGILVKLDLTQATGKPSAAGTALSIQSKPIPGGQGDGLVHIGYVDATGVDLRSVFVDGDLGQIDAGDSNLRTPALRALSVRSLGVYGAEYGQPGMENRSSDFRGNIGAVKILNDVYDAAISVSGDASRPGSMASLYIGGSLIGTDQPDTGKIEVDGAIGTVVILGSLEGGSGDRSGRISGSSLSSLFVRGSILGGSGESSGSVEVSSSLGAMRIGQDLVGGTGRRSGLVDFGFRSRSVFVGGSILGGDGDNSGRIQSGDDIDLVRIGGNLAGGSGNASGTLDSGDDIDKLQIGGSILGGKGDDSGGVRASGDLKFVGIRGSIIGANLGASATSSIDMSGYLRADRYQSLTVFGSLVAGENKVPAVQFETPNGIFTPGSAVLSGITDTSTLKPGFKVVSGDFRSKIVSVDSSNTVTLEDPFPAATGAVQAVTFSSPTLTGSGLVYARETIGSVAIYGDVRGNTTQQALLIAQGIPQDELSLRARSSIAIAKVFIGGSVSYSSIAAGLDDSLTPVNPDAQIGSIQVNQNWVCSDLIAGISPGSDGFYGTNDDSVAVPSSKFTNRSNLLSTIASIRIGGQILGSEPVSGLPADPSHTDHFGFVASRIGTFIVSGAKLTIRTGTNTAAYPLGAGTESDVRLREILPAP